LVGRTKVSDFVEVTSGFGEYNDCGRGTAADVADGSGDPVEGREDPERMGGGGGGGDGVRDDQGGEPVVDILFTALDDWTVVVIILALVDIVDIVGSADCVVAVCAVVVEGAAIVGTKTEESGSASFDIEDCGSICRLWRRKVDDGRCDIMETEATASGEGSQELGGILDDLTRSGIRMLSLVLVSNGDDDGIDIEWASKRMSRRASMRRA
jgi:hypothetical protein